MSRPAVTEPQWFEHAACRGRGWQAFFDDADPSDAQWICAGCPVRMPCLRYAMTNGIDEGVWGGLTPEQRRRTRASQVA